MEIQPATEWEQWTAAAANVATILAIAIGGWWTYVRFIRERGNKLRAAMDFSAKTVALTPDDKLLRVKVRVENCGTRELPIRSLRCEVYRVSPADENTLARLGDRQLIPDHEADLPCVYSHTQKWEPGEAVIEPSESDAMPYDFVVDAEIETVLVYAYLENPTERDQRGWDVSDLYNVSLTRTPEEASS